MRKLTSMKTLRTPDDRFADLVDYDFDPSYTEIVHADGTPLRIHHADVGSGPTVLLMHGEPSWSYLYRNMIPPLVAAGLRCVAPDLVGFGRSDKPAKRTDYTFERHVAWMEAWLLTNDLTDITLFCQDWGGLIGLRLVAAHPERFSRVIAANTGLPTGDQTMPDAFLAWQQFAATVEEFPVSAMLQQATVRDLSPGELASYDAPFPDESYKEGARIFPSLVPTNPNDPSAAANRSAWDALRNWDKPFVTAFSDSDPITAGGDQVLQKLIPGATGQPHTTIVDGGHFLQEDQPTVLAALIASLVAP